MYFPLFLPLWGIRKGNKGNFMPKYVREVASGKFSVFKHCSLLYQEVLRNPALLFLLSERKCSLWYWHRNALTVPVHLLELPFICCREHRWKNISCKWEKWRRDKGNLSENKWEGVKGKKIVVGNAEKKLFSAFLTNYSIFLI